jgi:hypothetical protein
MLLLNGCLLLSLLLLLFLSLSTQTPIQWVPGALSPGLKRPGREADHSPPFSADVKECVGLYLHSPITPSWRGVQLHNKKKKSTRTTLPYISLETFGYILVYTHIITYHARQFGYCTAHHA